MKLKRFLDPNPKIALTIIFIPFLFYCSSLLIQVYFTKSVSFETYFQILESHGMKIVLTIIYCIIPALFIASSLLLKTKKIFSYYLVPFLTFTIFEILMIIMSGAIPITQLDKVPGNLLPIMLHGLISTPIIYLIINPFFLIWIPKQIAKKVNLNWTFVIVGILFIIESYILSLITSTVSYMSGLGFYFNFSLRGILLDIITILFITIFSLIVFNKFKRVLKRTKIEVS